MSLHFSHCIYSALNVVTQKLCCDTRLKYTNEHVECIFKAYSSEKSPATQSSSAFHIQQIWQDVLWFGYKHKMSLSAWFHKKIHLKYNWYIVRFIYFIEVSCSFWVCSRNNSIMSVLSISVKCGLHHNQMVESLKREDNTTSFPILSLSLSFSLSLRSPLPMFLRTAAICAVSQWHPDISHLKSCHSSQAQTSVREWVRAREMQPRRASAQLVLYCWKSGGVS